MTPGQVRAARALLDWTRAQLSDASGVPVRTLVRYEGGESLPRPQTVEAVRSTLEAVGVVFIEEDGGGPGVRLAK